MLSAKEKVQEMLMLADIVVGGGRPFDIQVHNEDFYRRVLGGGELALGESYMDGWWGAKELDQFFDRALSADLEEKVKTFSLFMHILRARLINLQTVSRAFRVGEEHYDVGNDLYKSILDKRMVYTCGYWKEAVNLEEAQIAKLDLVCRKLGLKKGQRVLDIGGGWGSFAKYASLKYSAHVVAITVSKEQAELGKKLTKGLPVEIRLQDYREVNEKFDHVVSLGMFEHVGYKNYRTYMETVHRCLKDEGLFVLHTIGSNQTVYTTDPWIEKYIFPNGMLPSIAQIGSSIEKLFVMEDWHNFGTDYDKTLMAWFKNFDSNWGTLKKSYSERFYRKWKYYFMASAGSFRSRKNQLWQIVLSKNGVLGGYRSIR